MASIDHLYFPHIIDLIFEYAPIDSLIVMGQVCREWRERVGAEFYHIRDFSFSPGQTHSGFPSVPHCYRFKTVSGRCASTPDGRWAANCRVIDVGAHSIDIRYKPLTVDTVRIQYPVNSALAKKPLGFVFARRIVFERVLVLDTPHVVQKLVINYHKEGLRVQPFISHQSGQVWQVVLIVHLSAEELALNQYWLNRHADAIRLRLMQLAGWTGPDIPLNIQYTNAGVKLTYVAVKAPPPRMCKGYQYRSLREYRADIGEEEWAIETNFDEPLKP